MTKETLLAFARAFSACCVLVDKDHDTFVLAVAAGDKNALLDLFRDTSQLEDADTEVELERLAKA